MKFRFFVNNADKSAPVSTSRALSNCSAGSGGISFLLSPAADGLMSAVRLLEGIAITDGVATVGDLRDGFLF